MRERECAERGSFCDAVQLGDAELIAGLKRCVAQERVVTARLLVHFGEVDARGLFRDQGYASMFAYAVIGLHMSEAEAMVRIRVSRLGRVLPVALQMLAHGEVHLTALKLLAPVLTRDNLGLLDEARFKSKQQVLELLAKHFPKPDAETSIRRLPVRLADGVMRVEPEAIATRAAAEARAATAGPDATVASKERPASFFQLTPPSAASVVALSPGRYKIQFTADERVRDKLKLAQDLLRHHVPGGDVALVVERALDLLIASRKKQLFAETDKPRRLPRTSESSRADDDAQVVCSRSDPARASRHIPHAVRREVVARDGEQCCFVGPDGTRCPARGRLEFHHQVPYARGGPAASDNVQLLCRAHNALMAERDFGLGFIRAQLGRSP
jgi:5-methylcytosine-specific restriction endonuclease McrA